MVCQIVIFNHHVIQINFQVSPELTCEHCVHQMLMSCSDVFKSEWHNFVAEVYGFGDKFHLLLIPWVNLYLIVTKICKQKTQQFVFDCSINQAVNVRE